MDKTGWQLFRLYAELRLAKWAACVAERDELVRGAFAAGIPKHRIHTLTGIARTTIDRILAAGGPPPPPVGHD